MRNIYKLDDASRESAKAVVAEWSAYAFRTGVMTPAERETVKDAVEALYRAGGKEPPPRHRIVIAPSPMVARFAAGAAAWIWHCRKNGLARDATYAATDAKKNWWVGARGAAAAVRHLTPERAATLFTDPVIVPFGKRKSDEQPSGGDVA